MRKLILLLGLFIVQAGYAYAIFGRFVPNRQLLHQARSQFRYAAAQYLLLMKRLPYGKFPKTYYAESDSLETSGASWWCSGFYPGTLLLIYDQTKDQRLLNETNQLLQTLAPEQYDKSTHDLGFMMYCSFGNALKINPKPEYKNILVNSANSLASRFDSKIGCIRSWDSKKPEFLVIIDNMMNLELLIWATRVTGDSSYYRIAVTHANTTMKNHFRADYSSYHVVNYNPSTGTVQQKRTAQGYSDESAWARGQAWGLYGFTTMYRETHDFKYLQQAKNIAGFIINNPNLPADKIPYWDFNAPDIPHALRDAAAGAVIASALLELSRYVDKTHKIKYLQVAEIIIGNLSKPQYLASAGTNGGFLLQHSVGHMPKKTEVDVPLTYADYYYIEALSRYIKLGKITSTKRIYRSQYLKK